MCTVEDPRPICLDCVEPFEIVPELTPLTADRRGFLKTAAGVTAGIGALGILNGNAIGEEKKKAKAEKPAEALIKELFSTLSDDQKSKITLPWDHGAKKGRTATRLGMYNRPYGNQRIDQHYTKPQQELVNRILHAICSDDDGFRRISRDGEWDSTGAFERCGSHIFGDPSGDEPFAWLFTGHHLTVRCDGNSLPGAAFGGPVYYGHLEHGYSKHNVFNYQTKSAMAVFESLNPAQQKQAIADGTPGEKAKSIRLHGKDQKRPGIDVGDLSADQRKLVDKVMRDVLSPYRKEDVDEVMEIVKANGGMDEMHLAFYADKDRPQEGEPWHFWRLDGPGFVWNFRVLPHVHCYVNIAKVG
ncbi:MAG: hypothetical protein CMJ78_27810 [Planctomycetaceae bacterium]|nr:hypothetical protein [Planctomycetaceae bacterium]